MWSIVCKQEEQEGRLSHTGTICIVTAAETVQKGKLEKQNVYELSKYLNVKKQSDTGSHDGVFTRTHNCSGNVKTIRLSTLTTSVIYSSVERESSREKLFVVAQQSLGFVFCFLLISAVNCRGL